MAASIQEPKDLKTVLSGLAVLAIVIAAPVVAYLVGGVAVLILLGTGYLDSDSTVVKYYWLSWYALICLVKLFMSTPK